MRAVNLLPPDLRSGPKGSAPAVSSGVENSGPGAFIVLGVLAFCVVALASYVLAGNTVKDRQAELAAATAKSAAVSQQVTTLKPYADFESVANTRVQTVTDLANSRFDWEQALRDLSRAVPSDVTIGSLKGALAGSDPSSTPDGVSGPSIKLTGCTYSQTKVAALMARLRTIDGVEQVLLSKSDKEVTTADGDRNAPNSSGYCGRASIPAFDLTVVFKETAAAITATPGAAAAGSATTATASATPTAGATPAPAAGAAATPAPAAGAAPAATAAPASTTTPTTTTP